MQNARVNLQNKSLTILETKSKQEQNKIAKQEQNPRSPEGVEDD